MPSWPLSHELRDALLHVGEIAGRTLRPVGNAPGELRGLHRIGLERADHVHPVQGVQMVEMHDVVLHVLGAEHQVADQFGVGRNDDAQRVLDGAHRGQGVHGGADAAGALGKRPGVARIAPARMISSPRTIVPELKASVTMPSFTSTSMRRWPSMRVTGSMTIRLVAINFLLWLCRLGTALFGAAVSARPRRLPFLP